MIIDWEKVHHHWSDEDNVCWFVMLGQVSCHFIQFLESAASSYLRHSARLERERRENLDK